MREQSISSPLSTSVIGPTIAPAFLAYRCSSSRSASSDTSTSSMIGSHSSCVVERFFAGAFDRVLQQVEQTADAGRLALLDQLLAPAADQQRLHVALGLRQVEQLAAIRAAAHLDDAFRLVEPHVRQRPRRNLQMRRPAAVGGLHDAVGQAANGAEGFLVLGGQSRLPSAGFLVFLAMFCFLANRRYSLRPGSTISTFSPKSSSVGFDLLAAVVELRVGFGGLAFRDVQQLVVEILSRIVVVVLD